MDDKDMKKLVLDYVKREYLEEGDDREVTDSTPLISGGIVDSFSMVSLKRFLEKKFAISIPMPTLPQKLSTQSTA